MGHSGSVSRAGCPRQQILCSSIINSCMNSEQIDKAISNIKGKMKLINYNNVQPPYFLHTLSKFRETYLSPFIKEVNLEGKDSAEVREKLKVVHYIIENFDDECFDSYTYQLVEPYTRKMFQDNYGFDAIDFKEANTNYHLRKEIQETLSAAAEWLTQIEVTQDLLSRLQLYFKIKTPHVIEKVKQEGYQSEKNTWSGTFKSYVKRVVSYSLRKGSKVVQSTFWTALAPGAIMLTLAIMGGTATIPWKTDLDINSLIPALAVMAVPYALDTMADTVEKSDCSETLRRWAFTFSSLSENITKFNECLESSIRNCTISATVTEFQIERTNLEKIIHDLNKNISSITDFSEEKLQEMRERTEAYFKQYVEVQDGGWTVVIPKGEQAAHLAAKAKEEEALKQIDE